jgi:hypothetical protein
MSDAIILTKQKSLKLLSSSVIFLATIAWSDIVNTILKIYFPENFGTIIGKIIYALITTFFVVLFLIYFEKYFK